MLENAALMAQFELWLVLLEEGSALGTSTSIKHDALEHTPEALSGQLTTAVDFGHSPPQIGSSRRWEGGGVGGTGWQWDGEKGGLGPRRFNGGSICQI